MAQAAVFLGLAQLHDLHQPVGPSDQFLGVARGARQQPVQGLRRTDEAVLGALLRRQHFVEQAFAHAEGRNTIVFGLPTRMMYSSTSAA